ncbi:MAG: twin-arginine translocation signal domain-containing protein [Burkholderiaceae bacterium]
MSKLELIDWHLNPRPETPDFTAMMERTNRRGFMGMTAAAAGVLTFLNGSSASAATTTSPSLGFKAVPASSAGYHCGSRGLRVGALDLVGRSDIARWCAL